jgi:TM2 domain
MNRALKCVLILLVTCVCSDLNAQSRNRFNTIAAKIFFEEKEEGLLTLRPFFGGSDSSEPENPRLVAIILDATLGVLGMHRIYLGTDLKVPILYTFTLGGGGILWLVDLGLLIFTDDITPYMNNPSVFMWTKLK